MKSLAPSLAFPVVIFGAVVVIPFMLMESVSTQGFSNVDFPVSLFAFLWLTALVFVSSLMLTLRDIRSGTGITSRPFRFAFRTVLMILIAAVWITVIDDQMPCFMGVPNCD